MIILGAGGFAKQILEIVYQNNYNLIDLVFFDNVNTNLPKKFCNKFKILNDFQEVEKHFKLVSRKFIIGVGNPRNRFKLYEEFIKLGGECEKVISHSANLAHFECNIGEGSSILTNSILEIGVHIGKGSLINVDCLIAHDTVIGDFCDIGPGAKICGNCSVDDFSSIGAGAVILPKIKIGKNAIIGAGSVVTKNIKDNSVAYGNPAKIIKKS